MDLNAAHFHLILNHIPILTTLLAIPVLFWGLVTKQQAIQKVALAGFILAGLVVIPVVQSGEAAEDIAESVPGVSEQVIHEHEEAAEITQWLSLVMGALAMVAYFLMKKHIKYTTHLLWILLAYSFAVGSAFIQTAYLGGKIMHPEISGEVRVTQYPQNSDD